MGLWPACIDAADLINRHTAQFERKRDNGPPSPLLSAPPFPIARQALKALQALPPAPAQLPLLPRLPQAPIHCHRYPRCSYSPPFLYWSPLGLYTPALRPHTPHDPHPPSLNLPTTRDPATSCSHSLNTIMAVRLAKRSNERSRTFGTGRRTEYPHAQATNEAKGIIPPMEMWVMEELLGASAATCVSCYNGGHPWNGWFSPGLVGDDHEF